MRSGTTLASGEQGRADDIALIVHHSANRSVGCKASLLDLPRSFDGRRQRGGDVGDDRQFTHVLLPQALGRDAPAREVFVSWCADDVDNI